MTLKNLLLLIPLSIYVKQKGLSITFGGGWQGRRRGWTRRRGQRGGGVSRMESLNGDTFPEQCQVTQLVCTIVSTSSWCHLCSQQHICGIIVPIFTSTTDGFVLSQLVNYSASLHMQLVASYYPAYWYI